MIRNYWYLWPVNGPTYCTCHSTAAQIVFCFRQSFPGNSYRHWILLDTLDWIHFASEYVVRREEKPEGAGLEWDILTSTDVCGLFQSAVSGYTVQRRMERWHWLMNWKRFGMKELSPIRTAIPAFVSMYWKKHIIYDSQFPVDIRTENLLNTIEGSYSYPILAELMIWIYRAKT
jgi:hypothetical protein